MRLLAIDPGKTSGLAILQQHSRGLTPWALTAAPFDCLPDVLEKHITIWMNPPTSNPPTPLDYIVLEGWESHGRSLNINVRWALEAIGMVRAAAHLHGIPLFEAYSSQWKPQYQRGWELMKVPEEVKARKAERCLAHHIYHDLKDWPDDLVAIKEPDKGHVINALGLGLWAIPQLEQQAKLEALGY